MPLLDTLEKHLGRYAVPGLVRYVVGLNALVFLLAQANPHFVSLIALDRDAILAGQIWRLATWVFIPTTFSLLFVVIYLMFTWFLGDLLEGAWGAFRLNAYYLCGIVAVTVSAFLFGQSMGNFALNASLLFAAATVAPNFQIMFMLVIPMKLKWVGLIGLLFPLYAIAFAPLPIKLMTVACFANYLVFFGPAALRNYKTGAENAARRRKFEIASHPAESLHRCAQCGRTEVSDPDLDFRVSRDGREYCADHLPARTGK